MYTKCALLLVCVLAYTSAKSGFRRYPSNQIGEDYNQDYDEEYAQEGGIPGVPGEDYPIFAEVPYTSFSCKKQQYPGYYADPETQCQAYYICEEQGRGIPFLCPNGTVFNQMYLVCDWWYNVVCSRTHNLYSVNGQISMAMEEADARIRYEKQNTAVYNYNAPVNEDSHDIVESSSQEYSTHNYVDYDKPYQQNNRQQNQKYESRSGQQQNAFVNERSNAHKANQKAAHAFSSSSNNDYSEYKSDGSMFGSQFSSSEDLTAHSGYSIDNVSPEYHNENSSHDSYDISPSTFSSPSSQYEQKRRMNASPSRSYLPFNE